jgi:cyclopropane fatty-acyl-phospholipid synthase-like methyltransferase
MRVAGITVSQEQLIEAQARVKAADLSDRIDLLFCDYRDVPKRFGNDAFDAIVRSLSSCLHVCFDQLAHGPLVA